jgi:hypothetical protein
MCSRQLFEWGSQWILKSNQANDVPAAPKLPFSVEVFEPRWGTSASIQSQGATQECEWMVASRRPFAVVNPAVYAGHTVRFGLSMNQYNPK